MKIVTIEDVHGDGGWQTWSFLRIVTDEGLVGWSEFSGRGTKGLGAVLRDVGATLIGRDPREIGRIEASLAAATRIADGGLNARAASAIVNACLDLKAKALGVPVHALFGGPVRREAPVYWSHCGLFRSAYPALFESMGLPPVRRLDDLRALGAEAAAKGYKALKTNLIVFDGPGGTAGPSLMRRGLDPAGRLDPVLLSALTDQMAAFAEGAGSGVELMIDLNFAFKPEGFRRVARALELFPMAWLEIDLFEPQALADVRRSARVPIASLEAVYGRRGLLPYLQAGAVDVAIVDMMWNGLPESLRMASLADTFQVNVAAHTAGSPFHALMGAHFAVCAPNFQVLEYDADVVPWAAEVFPGLPTVERGVMPVPEGPGWGVDIDEAALARRPAK